MLPIKTIKKSVITLCILLFCSCELLVFLRDGKPEKSDFQLYNKGFVNEVNFPRLDGIYIWGVEYEGEMYYRYYKFFDSGQVFYGFLNSLELNTDSVPFNFKAGQKGYYQLIKKDFLKLEMFANGYRFYYFLETDINATADTIALRKQTMHDGSKQKRLTEKYIFVNKQLRGAYPTW